ncbi:pilus assembly protein PilP [Salinispirillum marinum]|uniref:Pilus assembly protein PilP n=2 Tax=Saccharospirillaceae TaxID=255527 RepID=A0ABV8BBD6_9GAMM
MNTLLSRWTLFGVCLGLLAGCESPRNFDDIRARMAELDSRPTGTIPDVPNYEAQELFFYSASGLRSPFQPFQRVEELAQEIQETGIQPDMARPKQPLEAFPLNELTMVGFLHREGEPMRALIRDPQREIHSVRIGDYMGTNYGQISAISAQGIRLVEIVSNGRGGWLERPQTLDALGQ